MKVRAIGPVLYLTGATLLLSGIAVPGERPMRARTFFDDVAPILKAKCIVCHSEGGQAPFPLRTFDQVHKRRNLIVTMAITQAMPPAYGISDFGTFSTTPPLTDEERVVLQDWVYQGGARGTGDDPEQVPTPEWKLGEPDLVLRNQIQVEAPAEGNPYWRAYTVELGANRRKLLRGFQIVPNDPKLLRWGQVALARNQAILTERGRAGFDSGGSVLPFSAGMVGSWAPNYPVWQLPHGTGFRLDCDRLVVHTFSLPLGRKTDGGFKLGLYFAPEQGTREARSIRLGVDDFIIDPKSSLSLDARTTIPQDGEIVAVVPEARFFCERIQVSSPSGILFYSRLWNPYWQGNYQYPLPVRVKAGDTIAADWKFANDIHQRHNDDTISRPIPSGYRERSEIAQVHLLFVPSKDSRTAKPDADRLWPVDPLDGFPPIIQGP